MAIIPPGSDELPEIDDRLVAPGSGYEIIDGMVVYVPPADPPHGESHASAAALVRAHRAPGYTVAVDLLTRTSRIDDIAPDVSLYPSAPHPETGRRQIEELTFQVASSESLSHCGKKAAKLVSRGVRRVFAIDVERERALEWNHATRDWAVLDRRAQIEDPALAVPISVIALIDAARADDAIAHALRAKRHPEFAAERDEGKAEGKAEALLEILAARSLVPTPAQRRRILAERDLERLGRWVAVATACASIGELLDG